MSGSLKLAFDTLVVVIVVSKESNDIMARILASPPSANAYSIAITPESSY